jgi:hypothetical protein
MSFRFLLLAAATGAAVSVASPAFADFTINFADANLDGVSTPFTADTSDGNVVTFNGVPGIGADPAGTGTFVVNPGTLPFATFQAGLLDTGFGFNQTTNDAVGDTLTISFANPIEGGVLFDFGIEDIGGFMGNDFLTVTSNLGPSVVSEGTLSSEFGEPEGSVFIDAPGTTELTITSANPFAIGNINVPEPITLSILGTGLAGLTAVRRRRRA